MHKTRIIPAMGRQDFITRIQGNPGRARILYHSFGLLFNTPNPYDQLGDLIFCGGGGGGGGGGKYVKEKNGESV